MPLQQSREKAFVFLTIGLAIGAVGASALINLSKYISLFESDKMMFGLCATLMATTIFWFVGWFKFDNDEITIISDYVIEEHRLRRGKYMMILAPVLLGLLFVVLIALVTELIPYIIVVIVLLIMTALGDTYVYSLLCQVMITDSADDAILKKTKWDDKDKESIKIIRSGVARYYLENRYFFRVIVTLSLLFIALLFSFRYVELASTESQYVSYVLVIAAILCNEAVVWSWRIKRDNQIKPHVNAIESKHEA